MKRILAGILALLLITAAVSAGAEESGEQSGKRDHTSFVVAGTTPMRGRFFTEMWGNATSDIDVRDLLHGYNLVYWDTENGLFTVDPTVVSDFAVLENKDGDHTYILMLCDDLLYSDGTPVTAWDYAFSYLFSISPVLTEIGAEPLRREYIAGYGDYIENGRALSGVRVLADNILSVTLDHRYLPFFYETGLLYCNPYPVSVIAPGVKVQDSPEGVRLANIDASIEEPVFTAELLAATVLDPDKGYLSHPSVCSGPYVLTSWDGVTAEFEINPYYKGNHKGKKPSIRHLTYTLAFNDSIVSRLENGEIDLLNKVTRADQIEAGMALADAGSAAVSRYPRTGLSYISFSCEKATVAEQAVRPAIAYCFDREAVTEEYTGSCGTRADGYYGIGQWMYEVVMGIAEPPIKAPEEGDGPEAAAAYEAELAAFKELNLDGLNAYAADTARAAALLEENGWALNEDGLREKNGVVLDLRLIYPEGNNIYESLQKYLADNLETVGIRLTMEAVPMNELLARWYKQEEREDDMIYLASNFDVIFDPSAHFNADGAWSYTNLADEELYRAAEAMRTTKPGDTLTYMRNWVEFEERFNTVLPMIPVYSNSYFDFCRNDLRGYDITGNVTWAQAIVGASLAEQ